MVPDAPQSNSSNHHDNLCKSRFYWPQFPSEEIELRGHQALFSKLDLARKPFFPAWSKCKTFKTCPWAGLFTLKADLTHPFKSYMHFPLAQGFLSRTLRVWASRISRYVKYYVQLDFSSRVCNLQQVSRGPGTTGGVKNHCPGVGPCREGPVLTSFTKVVSRDAGESTRSRERWPVRQQGRWDSKQTKLGWRTRAWRRGQMRSALKDS